MIDGKYQVKLAPPFTPGSELAGEVLAVGDGVSIRPGQRVSATTFVGAFAEQALLPEAAVSAIPDDVDFASAAAFGVTYRTAYHALRSIEPPSASLTSRTGFRLRTATPCRNHSAAGHRTASINPRLQVSRSTPSTRT